MVKGTDFATCPSGITLAQLCSCVEPSLAFAHQNYFQISKDHVTWIRKLIECLRIVVWHMRVWLDVTWLECASGIPFDYLICLARGYVIRMCIWYTFLTIWYALLEATWLECVSSISFWLWYALLEVMWLECASGIPFWLSDMPCWRLRD